MLAAFTTMKADLDALAREGRATGDGYLYLADDILRAVRARPTAPGVPDPEAAELLQLAWVCRDASVRVYVSRCTRANGWSRPRTETGGLQNPNGCDILSPESKTQEEPNARP